MAGYKKPTVGGNESNYGDNGKPAENDSFDVENVDVGVSSTKWGGEGSGSKAKPITRAELHCDRNESNDGPMGGPQYGGGTYTNKAKK